MSERKQEVQVVNSNSNKDVASTEEICKNPVHTNKPLSSNKCFMCVLHKLCVRILNVLPKEHDHPSLLELDHFLLKGSPGFFQGKNMLDNVFKAMPMLEMDIHPTKMSIFRFKNELNEVMKMNEGDSKNIKTFMFLQHVSNSFTGREETHLQKELSEAWTTYMKEEDRAFFWKVINFVQRKWKEMPFSPPEQMMYNMALQQFEQMKPK